MAELHELRRQCSARRFLSPNTPPPPPRALHPGLLPASLLRSRWMVRPSVHMVRTLKSPASCFVAISRRESHVHNNSGSSVCAYAQGQLLAWDVFGVPALPGLFCVNERLLKWFNLASAIQAKGINSARSV
ncbi:hypothetical protein Q8A73_018325 [Channa argus]|nr:hypothetical protein Q8A73_018325 [Channa argus]